MFFSEFDYRTFTIMVRKKRKSIRDRYREILRKPKLSDEEIDRMRVNVRLLAFALTEHILKTKVEQIY